MKIFNWGTRPRLNRWSLFSRMMSVCPFVTKTNNVEARKTKQRIPCMKIMTTYWLGAGGSLWSLTTCILLSLDLFIANLFGENASKILLSDQKFKNSSVTFARKCLGTDSVIIEFWIQNFSLENWNSYFKSAPVRLQIPTLSKVKEKAMKIPWEQPSSFYILFWKQQRGPFSL